MLYSSGCEIHSPIGTPSLVPKDDFRKSPFSTKPIYPPSDRGKCCHNCSEGIISCSSSDNAIKYKSASNDLIQQLTEQITSLHKQRETAILEAVEKDRYVYFWR